MLTFNATSVDNLTLGAKKAVLRQWMMQDKVRNSTLKTWYVQVAVLLRVLIAKDMAKNTFLLNVVFVVQ